MALTADSPCGAGDLDPLGVESPIVVLPPDPNMSRGTSSRRPLWSRRGFDISPVPSPLIRSKQGERYRDHQPHCTPDENIRSPRFHSPLRRSKSVPFPKRSRLEDGRKGSSSGGGRHCYNDKEGSGSRDRYDDGRHTQELAYPTSYDHGHHCLGGSKRNSSPHCCGKRSLSVQRYPSPRGKSPLPMPVKISQWEEGYKNPSSPTYYCEDEQCTQRNSCPNDHGKRSISVQQQSSPSGKPPLPIAMEMPPWDDGSWSPTNPIYRCEDVQYIQSGSHDDDQGGTSDCCDSTFGGYDDSRIVGSSGVVGSFTEKKDFAYDALVDDFMAAVSKSWYNPVPNKTVDKEAFQKQANRFAELALKRYNKNRNNKVKYALVEATVGGAIWEDCALYGHVNFYAKAKNGPKKNSGKVLVFAELHHIGRRQNAMVLTCFCFLDENNQLGGRRDQVQRPPIVEDIHHCYACSDKIKHPGGSCYKAGHVVDMLCYHYN